MNQTSETGPKPPEHPLRPSQVFVANMNRMKLLGTPPNEIQGLINAVLTVWDMLWEQLEKQNDLLTTIRNQGD